ncbi:hypothetical protein, partial [Lactiplantibacillus plantarum]|uniref:hypothetical protein n=1 Tax=Lactiplantibacillus plantarum TaxID=1590 RepID=UPI001C9E6F5B
IVCSLLRAHLYVRCAYILFTYAHVLAPLGLPPVALPARQNQSQVHSIFVFLILGGSPPPDQKNKISQNPVHQKSPLGS